MIYVKLIAEGLNISLGHARLIYDYMYIPGGFSNASRETIVREARAQMQYALDYNGVDLSEV